MSLVHDVTDRVQAQEVVRDSEERLRTIVENAWDGISIFDEDFRVQFESPSIARITDIPRRNGREAGRRRSTSTRTICPHCEHTGVPQEPARRSGPGLQDPVQAQGWLLAMDRGHRTEPPP